VNEPNENGLTPLHLAASSGSDYETDTVQVLIERGADLSLVDSEKGFIYILNEYSCYCIDVDF